MLVNLRAEMARYGLTDADIAKTIGRARRAVKNRLDGRTDISAEDIKAIRDAHFPAHTLDYLMSETPCQVVPKPADGGGAQHGLCR